MALAIPLHPNQGFGLQPLCRQIQFESRISRRIRILRGFVHEMPRYWIVPNVISGSHKCFSVENPHFRKSFLLNRRAETEFAPCTIGEASLNKLNRLLNGHSALDR